MLPGATYHVFNHANGRENLFAEAKNYDFFLDRLSLHVLPVAHMYAYCLMPNHFHLLLKIRSSKELAAYFTSKKEKQLAEKTGNIPVKIAEGIMNEDLVIKNISKSFSNLFNSYTQAYNKMYHRMGSLFMQNMKKEEVFNDDSFCKVVHYTHANPVHHQFVKKIDSWPHSSYKILLSKNPTKLERDYVLNVFGGLDKFIKYHEQPIDSKNKWFDS
jgi:putative transposase